MTDKAIEWFDILKSKFKNTEFESYLADAIEALKAQKVGKWIDQKGGGCCCSECGNYALDEIDGNFVHVALKSNYCPYCGSRMEGKK